MMTDHEWAVGWRMLVANPWPSLPDDLAATERLYREATRQLTGRQWGTAVKRLVASHRFFPVLAEVLEAAGAGDPQRLEAQAAWETLWLAKPDRVWGIDPDAPEERRRRAIKEDDRLQAALTAIGGWERLRTTSTKNLGHLRREFFEVWQAHREAERRGQLLPCQRQARLQIAAAAERQRLAPPPEETSSEDSRMPPEQVSAMVRELFEEIGE